MTEPSSEQPDPRTLQRMSSFVASVEREFAGTPDAGAPWDEDLVSISVDHDSTSTVRNGLGSGRLSSADTNASAEKPTPQTQT